MNKRAVYNPLAPIFDQILAATRGLPLLTAAWVAGEAMRQLNDRDRAAILKACVRDAARAALLNDCDGVTRRRYPINRDGEACFVLTDALMPGEAVDLARGLRAQASAAMRHAEMIELWRRQRWPEFASEGVQ